VLASGAMPRFIGLDVTHQALWRPAQQEAARQWVQDQSAPDPVARLAVELLDWYLRADLAAGLAGSPLHDPVAVAAAMWPALFMLEPRHVSVELASRLTRGQTVMAPEGRRERLETREGQRDVVGVETMPPNCHVALKLDGDRFVERFAARLGLR
jgi:inosine-uridine nucleoside N-ribohydrolase